MRRFEQLLGKYEAVFKQGAVYKTKWVEDVWVDAEHPHIQLNRFHDGFLYSHPRTCDFEDIKTWFRRKKE